MKKVIIFFALLLPMMASAYDFDEPNEQGVTIYYNYLSNTEVAMTYKNGTTYSGDMVIPETVTHGKDTYRVTSIGNKTFLDCINLTSVDIPSTVTSIGYSAFERSGLTNIVIPDAVTSIGYSAFWQCYSLGSVTIGKSVESIGDYAFRECYSLGSVTIGKSVESIGESAFSYCTALTSLDIPNSVTTIGGYAFYRCTSLTSLTIGKSLASIGDYAFDDCSKSLTSISVDPDNTYFNSQNNCNALIETASNTLILGCRNTTIPGTVTCIGEDAFRECYSMTSLTIPGSVTSIGNYAFSGCKGLTDIYCYAENCPSLRTNGFNNVSASTPTLHVLDVSEAQYKATEPWSQFEKIVGDIAKPKCATPTITYKNGKLLFECETEYVEFVYHLTTPDGGDSNSSEVSLPTAYTVSVYAKKPSCYNSDEVTKDIDIRGDANDVNGDGKITITDAEAVVNMILGSGN